MKSDPVDMAGEKASPSAGEALRREGLQLEWRIMSILGTLGFRAIGSDPVGVLPEGASADVWARGWSASTTRELDLSIACETKGRPQEDWAFYPHNYGPYESPLLINRISSDGDKIVQTKGVEDHDPLREFCEPRCADGVAIRREPDGWRANRDDVKRASRQALSTALRLWIDGFSYAWIARLSRPTISISASSVVVAIPLVVTTARLWKLEEPPYPQIAKASDDLDSLGSPVDHVTLRAAPEPAFTETVTRILFNKLESRLIDAREEESTAIGKRAYLENLCRMSTRSMSGGVYPVHVVRADAFRAYLKRLVDELFHREQVPRVEEFLQPLSMAFANMNPPLVAEGPSKRDHPKARSRVLRRQRAKRR
jgi:hypothetical protein